MKLTRSFFSIYLGIIFAFISFSYMLDEVWRSYLEQDIESYTGYKVMLHAVGDYLENHPEDDWGENPVRSIEKIPTAARHDEL